MAFLNRIFLDHPASVGEGYREHFSVAMSFGIRMLLAGMACMIHGVLPNLFKTTGSRQVRQLYDEMVANRVRHMAVPGSSGVTIANAGGDPL